MDEAQLYDKTPNAKITPPYQSERQDRFVLELTQHDHLNFGLDVRDILLRSVALMRHTSRFAKLPDD